MPRVRLRPGVFLVPQLGRFAGFCDDSRHRVFFRRREAEEIARAWLHLATDDSNFLRIATYIKADDTFEFFDPLTRDWYTWAGERIGDTVLYPIGEGAWTWSEQASQSRVGHHPGDQADRQVRTPGPATGPASETHRRS